MKRLFIWWHRRRAAWHEAMQTHTRSVFHRCWRFHDTWHRWHLKQIERLTK